MLTRSCSASNDIKESRKKFHDDNNTQLLPIEILMLQGYMSIEDINHLDIAICDADLRSLYLNSLQTVKIRDDTKVGRGNNFVTWAIKRQTKLKNFSGHHQKFTAMSANKMGAGQMRLDALKELELKHTIFARQSSITNATMNKIVRHCPMLRVFSLCNSSYITDSTITTVAMCCPMLQTLFLNCLGNYTAMTDVALI
jgi:hypothetical protein